MRLIMSNQLHLAIYVSLNTLTHSCKRAKGCQGIGVATQ